jgi:hypothetical protein
MQGSVVVALCVVVFVFCECSTAASAAAELCVSKNDPAACSKMAWTVSDQCGMLYVCDIVHNFANGEILSTCAPKFAAPGVLKADAKSPGKYDLCTGFDVAKCPTTKYTSGGFWVECTTTTSASASAPAAAAAAPAAAAAAAAAATATTTTTKTDPIIYVTATAAIISAVGVVALLAIAIRACMKGGDAHAGVTKVYPASA